MNVILNLLANLGCILMDIRCGHFDRISFHYKGAKRAVSMSLEKLADKAAVPMTLGGGSAGIATFTFWGKLGHFLMTAGQVVLLVASILSVLIGLYIAWPTFVEKWRKNGGLRVFWRG